MRLQLLPAQPCCALLTQHWLPRPLCSGKLRDIEILLQAYDGPDKALADSIFKILYATEDDFVAVDGDEAEEPVEAETKEVEV